MKMFSDRIDEASAHELDVIDAIVRGGGEARPEDAALTDFALLVRNARQVPDHGEIAALDARVQEALASTKPRERMIFKPAVAGFCALILVVGLVGAAYMNTGDGSGSTSTIDGIMAEKAGGNSLGVSEPSEGQLMQDAMPSSTSSSASSAAESPTELQKSAPSSARDADRSVAWTAELLLAAKGSEIDGLTDRVNEITDELGGYVADSNVKVLDDNRGVAGFTLMIPSDQRQEAMSQLSKLAHVRSREQSSEDITTGVNSAERDLKRWTARVNRLETQLAAATTTEQRVSLRRQLASAEARKRAITRQVRTNRGRVNYVPIELTIAADSSADDQGKGTLGKAVDMAGRILTGALAGLIIVAAALVPLTLIALCAWLGWRRWKRGRSARTLAAAIKGQPE